MMLLAAMALAAATTSYDCVLDGPFAVSWQDGKFESNKLGIPPELGWSFKLSVKTVKDGVDVDVVWPQSPMMVDGSFAALSTGKGVIAFVAPAGGPCLFTETSCITLGQLWERSDGTARLLMTSTAIGTDKKADIHEPFVALAQGTCKRTSRN